MGKRKALLSLVISSFISVSFPASYAVSQDKVVVIPLGGGATESMNAENVYYKNKYNSNTIRCNDTNDLVIGGGVACLSGGYANILYSYPVHLDGGIDNWYGLCSKTPQNLNLYFGWLNDLAGSTNWGNIRNNSSVEPGATIYTIPGEIRVICLKVP